MLKQILTFGIISLTTSAYSMNNDHSTKLKKKAVQALPRKKSKLRQSSMLIDFKERSEIEGGLKDQSFDEQSMIENVSDYEFKKETSVVEVVKEDNIDVEIVFTCSYCDSDFNSWNSWKEHVKEQHENEYPFVCKMCKYCGKSQEDLFKHLKFAKKHQKAKKILFPCLFCDETFEIKNVNEIGSLLENHIKSNHVESNKDTSYNNIETEKNGKRKFEDISQQEKSDQIQGTEIEKSSNSQIDIDEVEIVSVDDFDFALESRKKRKK